MKILIFLLFVYTSVFSKDVKIGIYLYKSLYQKANIVKIIYILQEQLNSLSKTDYTFKITPYFNEEDILRDFYTYKLSLILIDSQLLLKNQKKLFAKSNDLWKMTFTKKEFEQYLIIKNKKSNATLKNIKDHNIYVYAKDSISTLWFRKRIYEIHKNSYKEFLKKEKALLKENKILYKVFFEKNSIGVINKERLETLSEINPQIKKSIVILDKSDNIFNSSFVLKREGLDKEISEELSTLKKEYELFLTKSNVKGLIKNISVKKINKEDLKPLIDFYKKYQELKNTYDKK